MKFQEFALLVHPPFVDGAQHAHGLNDLGASEDSIGVVLGFNGASIGIGQHGHGFFLGLVSNPDLDHGPNQGHDTQPWTQDEDDQ